MILGTQFRARDDDDYRVMAQLGIEHVCADPAGNPHDWTLDILERHRDHLSGFGLTLDMIQLPLSSHVIEKQYSPDILSAGPDRDHQIDSICRLIERAAGAGIPAVKYNLNIIGIPARNLKRGGADRATMHFAGTRPITMRHRRLPASSTRMRIGSLHLRLYRGAIAGAKQRDAVICLQK
jgi:D-mannonate dehydratase